jgi:hypothetical protein
MISRIQLFLGLALLVLASAAPARANHVDRGASGNGVVDTGGNCVTDIQTDPACVQFTQLSSTTAQWQNYSLGSDGVTAVLENNFELFMVPTTGPVTLQLANSGVAYGSFMCGLDGDFGAIDTGMLASLNNFCNTFPDPTAILNPNPDTPDGSNRVTFGFINSSNLPADWVFYTTFGDGSIVPGGSTPIPEPTSALLLGTGLLALCGGIRRRLKSSTPA